MSTATAMPTTQDQNRILHVVPEVKAQFGLLVQARRLARQGYDKVISTSRSSWGWVRASFLDKAYTMITTAATWLMTQVRWVGSYIGNIGGAGLGLLALTTKTGRTILKNTLGRVWGWAKVAGSVAFSITLGVLERLGTPGNWVADRMVDVHDLALKAVNSIEAFYDKHLAKHMVLNSTAMTLGQMAGVGLVARQVLTLVAFTPLRYAIYIGTAIWFLFTAPIPTSVSTWWNSNIQEAASEVAVAADKKSDTYKEAATTAAKVVAEAPALVEPGNRAERRAASKDAANEARKVAAKGAQPAVALS